jgi:RNA polymerase sigma factor (sigma-70 family)
MGKRDNAALPHENKSTKEDVSSVLALMATHFLSTSSDRMSINHAAPTAEVEGPGARAAEISQLFRDHNRALVLFLASRLKDMQAAREVAQEAYVRVLQLEAPGAVSFLRSYLFKVAANLAVDRIRSQQSRAHLDSVEPFEDFLDETTPERTAIAREELALLGRVIGELPVKYQEAFQRHRVDEESFEDIARCMGIKNRMVRRYVTYTLIYLRLRREGVNAGEAWRQVHS